MKTTPRIIAKLPSTLEIPPSVIIVAPVDVNNIPPTRFIINSKRDGLEPSR